MSERRYRLEKGSKKHLCPDCGKKAFVFYIDKEQATICPNGTDVATVKVNVRTTSTRILTGTQK